MGISPLLSSCVAPVWLRGSWGPPEQHTGGVKRLFHQASHFWRNILNILKWNSTLVTPLWVSILWLRIHSLRMPFPPWKYAETTLHLDWTFFECKSGTWTVLLRNHDFILGFLFLSFVSALLYIGLQLVNFNGCYMHSHQCNGSSSKHAIHVLGIQHRIIAPCHFEFPTVAYFCCFKLFQSANFAHACNCSTALTKMIIIRGNLCEK